MDEIQAKGHLNENDDFTSPTEVRSSIQSMTLRNNLRKILVEKE